MWLLCLKHGYQQELAKCRLLVKQGKEQRTKQTRSDDIIHKVMGSKFDESNSVLKGDVLTRHGQAEH